MFLSGNACFASCVLKWVERETCACATVVAAAMSAEAAAGDVVRDLKRQRQELKVPRDFSVLCTHAAHTRAFFARTN